MKAEMEALVAEEVRSRMKQKVEMVVLMAEMAAERMALMAEMVREPLQKRLERIPELYMPEEAEPVAVIRAGLEELADLVAAAMVPELIREVRITIFRFLVRQILEVAEVVVLPGNIWQNVVLVRMAVQESVSFAGDIKVGKERGVMAVHQVYAQISEETVQNIIVCHDYEMANYLTRSCYGNEAFAVDCLQYPCGIGDKYRDGTFYRVSEEGNETPVEYVPTQEQQVALLTERLEEAELTGKVFSDSVTENQLDTDLRVTMLEIGSL